MLHAINRNNMFHVGSITISGNTHFGTLGVEKLIIKANINKVWKPGGKGRFEDVVMGLMAMAVITQQVGPQMSLPPADCLSLAMIFLLPIPSCHSHLTFCFLFGFGLIF